MNMLKATLHHPTSKKISKVISFLEAIKLELEWVDGVVKIRDHEFGVSFDLVHNDGRGSITDVPPTFEYKLLRVAAANKYCNCKYCKTDNN